MKPPWLESWLGAPLEALDVERLTQALDAARQITERLVQQEGKARSLKGHQDLVAMTAEWQEAIAELLRARASKI
ncbi:hypothetical protein D3C86_265660 [compost metagenome]